MRNSGGNTKSYLVSLPNNFLLDRGNENDIQAFRGQ